MTKKESQPNNKKPKDDSTNDSANDSANDATPNANAGPPYRIVSQYIQDLSFENPGALKHATGEFSTAPHHNANWHITNKPLTNKENIYEAEVRITLSAHYENEKKQTDTCFMLEVAMVAITEIAQNISDKNIHQQILRIEIPRILYPYLRHQIDLTLRSGGYPQLIVAPINFVAAYQHFLKQQES